MALLFAADRLDHVEAEVAPLLRDGYVVISDRYDLSSIAYQSATATDDAPARMSFAPNEAPSPQPDVPFVEWVRKLNAFARRPDVTVVVDVSPDTAAQRRRLRGGVQELYEDLDLQTRLASAYRDAEALMPGDRIVHIDGDADVDGVTAQIVAALDPILGVGVKRPSYRP
jgi:dTMP kinase